MPWFKADDGLSDNTKTRRAGTEAMGLWVIAGTWCARELTDGFVPKAIAMRWDSRGMYAKKLVAAGFWDLAEQEGEHGYQFVNWAEFQPTKAEVNADREAAARRMKAVRARRRANAEAEPSPDPPPDVRPNVQGNVSRTFATDSESVRPEFGDPDPTRPVLISGHLEGESLVANAHENEPPPPHCENHPGGTSAPCGACADARRRWVAANLERDQAAEAQAAAKAEAERQRKRRAAEDRARAVDDCGMCDAEGYLNGRVCGHDPEEADRAKRGIELARAALTKSKEARHE